MSNHETDTRPQGFLTWTEVSALIPISYPTAWQWMREKRFPLGLKIGDRKTVWRADEIMAWIASRPRQCLKQQSHTDTEQNKARHRPPGKGSG